MQQVNINNKILQVNKSRVMAKLVKSDEIREVLLTYHVLYRITVEKNPNFNVFDFHDPKNVLPYAFDIVDLLMDNSVQRRGWWDGGDWYCRKKKIDEKIVGWRKRMNETD